MDDNFREWLFFWQQHPYFFVHLKKVFFLFVLVQYSVVSYCSYQSEQNQASKNYLLEHVSKQFEGIYSPRRVKSKW